MQQEQNKVIVDCQGNQLKQSKKNNPKTFLKSNRWKILEIGFPTGVAIIGIANKLGSRRIAILCANYYGIEKKYFNETEMFQDKLINILCVLILFIYPFLFPYVIKKLQSKIFAILSFFSIFYILLAQNLAYTFDIIERISYEPLRNILNSYEAGICIILLDIIMAYFLIISVWRKKKRNKIINVLYTLVFLFYAVQFAIVFQNKISYDISEKKDYEVIEKNRAIIATYDGKLVTMNFEEKDGIITLEKGTYRLEEMTDKTITYHRYKDVKCE